MANQNGKLGKLNIMKKKQKKINQFVKLVPVVLSDFNTLRFHWLAQQRCVEVAPCGFAVFIAMSALPDCVSSTHSGQCQIKSNRLWGTINVNVLPSLCSLISRQRRRGISEKKCFHLRTVLSNRTEKPSFF